MGRWDGREGDGDVRIEAPVFKGSLVLRVAMLLVLILGMVWAVI